MQACDGCAKIAGAEKNPAFITEFANSFLFLGDHQYYEGYCVLMAKRHVRELVEMPPVELAGLMAELMQATRAVDLAFQPWKMNHACLGNVVQHVHWHILPRYESDPDRFQNPWFNMAAFASKTPDAASQAELIAKIRQSLEAL